MRPTFDQIRAGRLRSLGAPGLESRRRPRRLVRGRDRPDVPRPLSDDRRVRARRPRAPGARRWAGPPLPFLRAIGQGRPISAPRGRSSPTRRSLLTAEVCDDCQHDWRESLDDEFRDFWERLAAARPGTSPVVAPRFSVAAFKAMVAGALLIMPASELPLLRRHAGVGEQPGPRLRRSAAGRGGMPGLSRSVPGRGPAADPGPSRRRRRALSRTCSISSRATGSWCRCPCRCASATRTSTAGRSSIPSESRSAGYGPDFREARGVLLPLSVSARRPGRAFRHPAIAS